MKGAGAAALTSAMSAKSYAAILGANDRVRVAVVGVNSRGQAHMAAFSKVPNVAITHFVDCESAVLAKRAADFAARGNAPVKTVVDYRKLLGNKAVDVVTVATPDFSHVKIATDAMNAGHHVYCEKPVGLAPAEGDAMIAVQKRTGRVLQIGNQQRSSPETRQLLDLVEGGAARPCLRGADLVRQRAQADRPRHARHAAGDARLGPVGTPPRPRAPFRSNLVPYNWHWVWQYGTGEICNNGMHEIDVARWLMGVTYPDQVEARGSRQFFKNDDWEMYDTMDLTLAYTGDRKITWEGQSGNGVPRYGRGRGVLLLGTKGSAVVDRNGFELYDLGGKMVREVKSAAEFLETTSTLGIGALDVLHATNMVDVLRGKASALNSPIAEGNISTNICHLGNMAYRTRSTLAIDPGDGMPQSAEAMKLWSVDYQPGWEIKV
ncbi:Gfo/Idh/MocA family protein [Sphingomonas sp. MMS24-JH45]